MIFAFFLIPLILGKVPILSGDDLHTFLQNSRRSVVFFLAGVLHVEENGYDILQFKNKIDIIESTKDEGLLYNCTAFPCIVPFSDGVSLKGAANPSHTASFAEWLQYIISIDTIQVNTSSQAETLMGGNGSYIFAVDYYARPLNAPIGSTVYLIPSILLKGQVSKGLYTYNTALHTFNPIVYEKPDIVEPENIKFGSTKYISGFMLSKNGRNDAVRQNILTNISKTFRENITFTELYGPASKLFKRNGRLELISPPYFFIFDLEDFGKDLHSKKRWIVRGPEMNDIAFLKNFIRKVRHGQIPPTVISEPDPQESSVVLYRHLVASKFKEAVFEDTKDVIVLFQMPWSKRCHKFQVALRRVASLLKDTHVKIYWFDASENEIPGFVPDVYGFPTVLMWPAGKKEQTPAIYPGKAQIPDILQFILENASKKFIIPDSNHIETRLIDENL